MAGRQHETRPVQESIHKSQISDERGVKDHSVNGICDNTNDILRQPSVKDSDTLKNEEAVKRGIHFYTLSTMNESNRVNNL